MPLRVVAVVVTHNRRDLLAEALTAVEAQTRPPDHVVVVDNASTDGTADLMGTRSRAAAMPVELIRLRRNSGGAGGFAVGLCRALELAADAIWLLDDDAVATPGALEALVAAHDDAVVVASRVLWTDGADHPMNTPRSRPSPHPGRARIRSASFVSVLVDAAAVRERGLPVADYFLWNDDFEFTARLLRGRSGLLCRDSVVVHKTRSREFDPTARFFYEVRNKIWLFTRSPCLAPGERLLYAGSTLRRWIVAFARSRRRAELCGELARGLWAGIRTRPRPTEEILRDLRPPGVSPCRRPVSARPRRRPWGWRRSGAVRRLGR
ncbi:MAG TPA: glycosyltransferase family 2 protein [Streptosporangiaceae bacterium]|nr:glycosyltransferase family 2 protein [Streptosporangiaceae bacterium]